MRSRTQLGAVLGAVALLAMAIPAASAATPSSDISTLAGKVAALRGTAGLQVRFSSFLEEEAEEGDAPPPGPATPITASHVLSSPLDGTSIAGPNVLVNQDTAGAPQNETSIAVDPNNPSRVVASANDYVSRTWTCSISGTPCSALGDGYSGTYVSNDGGSTWCCTSSDPSHLGTLIPGVTRLTGGIYDAGGDPAVAFDSHGHVFYAGLGFDRAAAPNTVAVNRGTFDGSGHLSWGAPVFINQTTSPSTLNDKEWIAVDSHPTSAHRDSIYVTWTRFKFNGSAGNGKYTQSPIFFVRSTDGGATFSAPEAISGNVLYSQGSRPVVGPDGSLYVFWNGSTRLASLNSTWMVKSTDGGATFSKPVAVSALTDTAVLKNTAFRVNSFPAAAAAANGDLYATWTTEVQNAGTPNYGGEPTCAPWLGFSTATCHSVAVYSKSTDAGSTWSAAAPVFTPATQTAIGYPVTQPNGDTFAAPAAKPAEQVFPAAAAAPNGNVYLSAYSADAVSPWQTCAAGPPPPVGRITCDTLGNYVHNARLDYKVRDLTTDVTQNVNTHLINTRHGFGGGFFGDYTDIAVGSDNTFHALWTDSNDVQSVVWFYGFEFTPTPINQEDIVTGTGAF